MHSDRRTARTAEGAVSAVLNRVQLDVLYAAAVETIADAAGRSAFLPG